MNITTQQYSTIHKWAAYHIAANFCDDCGEDGSNSRLERANISGQYKRDVSDWRVLCVKCHRKYDNVNQKMSATIQTTRVACINGHPFSKFGFRVYKNKSGVTFRRCKECARLCAARVRAKKREAIYV